MIRICIFIVFCISILNAQEKKPVISTYYEQKKSMFDLLPDTDDEIIFLGNSISDGCEWSELFQDARIKNRGISGDRTAGIFARLDEEISSQPLKIFIMIGINDLATGIPVDSIMVNYSKIIQKIRMNSRMTQIYIQSVLPVHAAYAKFYNHTTKTEQIILLNEQLKQFCAILDLPYIDLHSHFKTEDNQIDEKYTNDGLHLTGSGYLLWKSIIEKYVRD